MLLAFETASRSATACVVADDGRELAWGDLGGGEAERGLVPLLDRLLRAHGRPRALACAIGPGSFTGLRVGIAAARTLAWIEALPVHPVDTLAALAAERGEGLWWVLLPLKRDTTFHGLYRCAGGRVETLAPPRAQPDAAAPAFAPELAALLPGAVACGPALGAKPGLAERWLPGVALGAPHAATARGVARIAAAYPAVAWEALLPSYGQEAAPVLQRAAVRPPAGGPDREAP